MKPECKCREKDLMRPPKSVVAYNDTLPCFFEQRGFLEPEKTMLDRWIDTVLSPDRKPIDVRPLEVLQHEAPCAEKTACSQRSKLQHGPFVVVVIVQYCTNSLFSRTALQRWEPLPPSR